MTRRVLSFALLLCLSGCSGASGDGGTQPAPYPDGQDGIFESDNPSGRSANGRGAFGDGAANAGPEAPTAGGDAKDNGAARAIEEADIIKINGSRLYALSQYGGLNVIDISLRDHLRLLGRKKVQAQPFEMYVRDSIVFALYNGYGEYVRATDDAWTWITTSYVIAFDTTDPANVQVIGRFAVPGQISDSRIVGDVLYVVGFQNGYCWSCDSQQKTTIISLNVKNPAAISKVAELAFAENQNGAYSWKRSVTVTDKRMYVAGPEWGDNGPVGSTIQVVDISDPSGTLKAGAQVQAAGQISNRWQMDEYGGVLRVVSQKAAWRSDVPPKVQTFTVASAQSIQPLGATDLVIPANEDLRSARFDGPRGYAITAVQTDPLFTIDLSDPAKPKQVGQLEMPGWVYHMEPRGDRVLALGFDQGNAAGGMNVSLFDVSNLATPTMLKRVNFGGDWSWAVEDQDRIHKAFKILDEAGLILMPFSGWASAQDGKCSGSYQSGVQLIDWANDNLVLRGVAPAYGQARRGFVHDGRLFAVSDERVETFNIDNRSAPQRTASLKLAHYVSQSVGAGDKVIRIAQNWWTNSVELDITTAGAAEQPDALGRIEIPNLEENRCYGGSWLSNVLTSDSRAYIIYNRYDYSGEPYYKETQTTRVLTLDISNPSSPKALGDAVLDFGQGWAYSAIPGVYDQGKGVVSVGSALVFMSSQYQYSQNGQISTLEAKLRVLDMADPNAPKLTTIALPTGTGITGLHASGNTVAFGHYSPSPTNPDRVRFYADRLDVSNPSAPVLRGEVNVPGSIIAYDAQAERIFTADYRRIEQENVTQQECYEKYANAYWQPNNGIWGDQTTLGLCGAIRHSVRLVALDPTRAWLLGSVELDQDEMIGATALGSDRLFVSANQGYYYWGRGGVADCFDCGGYYSPVSTREFSVLTLSGIKGGSMGSGRVTLTGGDFWSWSPIAAAGTRAVLSSGWRGKLSVISADNVVSPSVVREQEVFGSVWNITTVGTLGVASMGYDGVQTIQLGD